MTHPTHLPPVFLQLSKIVHQKLCRGFGMLIVLLVTYVSVASQAAASNTGVTGSNAAVETTNPNLALHWVICTSGLFPSRDYDPYNGANDEPFIGEIRCVAFNPAAGSFSSTFLPCDGRAMQISTNSALFSLLGTTYGGNGITTFNLPDLRGRVPVGFDNSSFQFQLGDVGGQETVTLNTNQLPSHSHTITGGSTGFTGGGQAFPNEQPYLALNLCMQGSGVFNSIGWIRVFGFNFVPPGFYPCNGGTDQILNNEPLFSQIVTTFGGNGTTTFGLPDFRGKSIVGAGAGPGLTNRPFGETGGSGSLTLTTANLPSHTHTIPGGNTGSAGSGAVLLSVQPYLALYAKIATQGLFLGIDDLPAIGEIRFFANSNTPNGFVDCNAADIFISQNNAMFALLGTTFGGNGVTTFKVPDLRGRRPVGTGDSPFITDRFVGDQWGAETISLSTAQMPAHVHSLAVAPTITTPTSASVTSTTVTLGGNVTSDGGDAITARGVVYSRTSQNGNPQIGGANVANITGSGTTGIFTVNVTGLTAGTGYSFAAYATNNCGTIYTSPVSIFTTATVYATWAASKGLTGALGLENGTADDPDKDGQNNLSEFALDGSPFSGANDGKVIGQVSTVGGDEILTLTLPVRTGAVFPAGTGDRVSDLIDGIIYRIEGDVNLSTFADTISEVTPALDAGLPTLSTGWTYRTFRAPGTVPTVPQAFLRAAISEAP